MNIPVLSSPVRISRQRLVLAAFVCLILLAVGLRFYDLPGKSVSYDEAIVSDNSSGSLSEVVPNTRSNNSSPILYPLALWVVQKADISTFSFRVLPATASVLTVVVMLFLLPRLGIARWAAFLAALLATLSVAAIEHAQDAREYSIDALLTLLMIAGLLWHLRDGRKVLLCVSLFLAPLLQYGLVLFGAAVLAAAVVLSPSPSPTLAVEEHNSRRSRERNSRRSRLRHSYQSRLRSWLKSRIALVWPAACFMAGCVISYVVTLRYQWQEGGWVGWERFYYQGAFDVADILGFTTSHTWELLNYHLPQAVAIPVVGALAIMLIVSLKRKRFDAIATLALLAIGIAIFAALLTLYPLGDIRQNIYLGPIIFLTAGVVIHWTADSLATLTRRAWLAPALAIMAAGAITLAGVVAMQQDSPYKTRQNLKSVFAILEEQVREEDLVYVANGAFPSIQFYHGEEGPDNYWYETYHCSVSVGPGLNPCLRKMVSVAALLSNVPDRLFLVYNDASILEGLELLGEQVSVEHVNPGDGHFTIALITYAEDSFQKEARSAYEEMVSTEPAIRADFDVYLMENTLVYVKEPCARADIEALFFLHLHPVDVNDLPDHRRQYGFDNLDFSFDEHGVISDVKCLARIPLPEYDIARITTGQFVHEEDGFHDIWEGMILWRERE